LTQITALNCNQASTYQSLSTGGIIIGFTIVIPAIALIMMGITKKVVVVVVRKEKEKLQSNYFYYLILIDTFVVTLISALLPIYKIQYVE
jgi:F0F1-type ATP synthase membrane subunit c/vacuolar-type H+-ATPase subunit K